MPAQRAGDGVPDRAVAVVAHPRREQLDVVATGEVERDPPAVGRAAGGGRSRRPTSRPGPRSPRDLHALAQTGRSVGAERRPRGPGRGVEGGLRPRRPSPPHSLPVGIRTCSTLGPTASIPGSRHAGRTRVLRDRAGRSRPPRGRRPRRAATSPPATCSRRPTRSCTVSGPAGLEQGDVVAMLLPNCIEVFELYLAVMQAGFYLVPINWHLVGPEIAYIVADSEAKAFVAHARLRRQRPRSPPTRSASPPSGRFAVGGEIPGFRSVRGPQGRPTDDAARRPHDRRGHELHVGHDRPPQGRAPRAAGRRARGHGARLRRHAAAVPAAAARRQRRTSAARRCTTPRCSCSRAAPAPRAHRRAHGEVDAGGHAPPDRQVQGHEHAHGADAVRPAARAPRRREGEVRRVVAAPHGPRGRARARPRSSGG